MVAVGQALALSIPCSMASGLEGAGRLLIAPIVAYVIFFPIILVFGGFGGAQFSGLMGTLALYFGSRTKLIVFGIALMCGAVGGGLIAATNAWAGGCAF
jgi:hypothetical protein